MAQDDDQAAGVINRLLKQQQAKAKVLPFAQRVRQETVSYWMYMEEQDGTLILSITHEGEICYASDYAKRLEDSAALSDENTRALFMSVKALLDCISAIRGYAAEARHTLQDAPEDYSKEARRIMDAIEERAEVYQPSPIILPPKVS